MPIFTGRNTGLFGSVGARPKIRTSSVSFKNAAPLIYYLDTYCVRGFKNTCYKLWRQCYVTIQNKAHLNPHGARVIYARKQKLSGLYASSKPNLTKI